MNTTISYGSPTLYTIGAEASVTNMILSIPLNSYVIRLILGASRETMASDFFSLNLALSEFLFALSGMCLLMYIFFYSITSEKLFAFFLGFLYTARPLFQCCICVEYYIGVIHPVLYLRFKPLRYRVACSCVLWLLNLLSCIYISSTIGIPVYLYMYFIQTVLFFSVMLFCCLSVLWALKRPGPGDGKTGKRTSNTMKRRAFKIISMIMTFMTFNYFFCTVPIPLQCCISEDLISQILSCAFALTLITGFMQPILYLHRSGKLPSLCKVKSLQPSQMCFIDCRKRLLRWQRCHLCDNTSFI